ncbi:hypothetical protein BGX23_001544, partial [Mortierella sp. AD031]
QYQDHHQTNNNKNTTTTGSLYYPLQFSTRARAMAYLIEILQSLQKEPCGCDLVKGCYCGQDGIEDHEGKSPCYICGEWYQDRRDSNRAGGGYEGGKAWHEQGSLRHHVAEAKVKKWLDSVWKPPLTPATTPEQETVRQFGFQSQEDLRQCHDHQVQAHRGQDAHRHNHQHQSYYQQQHQYQQHYYNHNSQPPQYSFARMEPGRPWSIHDIEIEARAKTSYTSASPHQDLSGSAAYGYASSSGSWHFTTSPASSKPVQGTPPTQRGGPFLWTAPPVDPSGGSSFGGVDYGYQARVRTMSCSDAPPSGSTTSVPTSSSYRSSTPSVMRSNSVDTSHIGGMGAGGSSRSIGRSKPARASTANSTFAIPQEILDPNYRSPTFRIKSWKPASSLTNNSNSSASSSSSSPSFTPASSRLSLSSVGSGSGEDRQKTEKQTLDGWTAAAPAAALSSGQESVSKSTRIDRSDQEDCMEVLFDAGGQQGNTREVASTATTAIAPAPSSKEAGGAIGESTTAAVALSTDNEIKESAPFQFNFTSSRFRAAVQAAASKDKSSLQSTKPVDVQKSAAYPEEVRSLSTLPPATVTADKDHHHLTIRTPALDVVIVTEMIDVTDSDKTGDKEHHDTISRSTTVSEVEPTTTTTAAITTALPCKTASISRSMNAMKIQKSAPMSPLTLLGGPTSATHHSSSLVPLSPSSSLSSSSHVTSTLGSPDPKSRNKNHGSGDYCRATSWSSLQKMIQTTTDLSQASGSGSMLHVDASSS